MKKVSSLYASVASASCLLVFHSSTDADYRQMICLVFALEVSYFAAVGGRALGTLTWTLRSAGLQEAAY